MRPVDREALADREGVHCEVESEGSVRQNGDVTNGKVIEGLPSGLLNIRSRHPKIIPKEGGVNHTHCRGEAIVSIPKTS